MAAKEIANTIGVNTTLINLYFSRTLFEKRKLEALEEKRKIKGIKQEYVSLDIDEDLKRGIIWIPILKIIEIGKEGFTTVYSALR
ncbi:6331_t:CDS:2 [Gigaspora rosea]|nr:6331_t:CDS:2 [Gigaspora rosea]